MRTQYPDDLAGVIDQLVDSCVDNMAVNHIEGHDLPDKQSVDSVLDMLLAILFPGYTQGKAVSPSSLPYYFGELAYRTREKLISQVERAFAYGCRQKKPSELCQSCDKATRAVHRLMTDLPRIRALLKEDVVAAFDHDPAAESLDVILFCYPGLEAIATQRLANVLYGEEVPIIPRMWTERAHSRTGIDIHPGAQIGRRFFIDHGTGVVIGETTVIGDNVTLYQGVTLGALAPAKGQRFSNTKRHPTIGDDVVIYAGATILGGETVIGSRAVIGGSVWLTESVPEDTRVMTVKGDLVFK